MILKTWDDVIKIYTEYSKSQFKDNINQMLALVSELKSHPEFIHIKPMTSHAALILKLPNKEKDLCVWAEEVDKFLVYYYRWNQGNTEEIMVDKDLILPTLIDYLHRM